jgi:CubicO group peptidase (beta-lactamase class C family)
MYQMQCNGRILLPRAIVAVLLATLLALAASHSSVRAQATFPEATPESQGLSSEALEALADVVQEYIDRDMAVGAELVVIKNRHTVLHEAFGWRDREAQIPMERDALFNIRSMTKPITGAAAQILIDEGKLALDDRVSDHLPGFDNDDSREITIEQLLTHRSGLPLSTLTETRQYESLKAMANATGEGGPEFEPGSKFWYSDAGTDVLGAIVEQASGSSLEDFVTSRLLQPLGMVDTYYAIDPDDSRLDRVASLYAGGLGNWNRFWGPVDEPFYPYAWGSQTLYSSPQSYARFLAMWMDDGLSGDTRILTPEAVARTLTPATPMSGLGTDAPYPTRFGGLTAYHGQMAVLHVDGDPVDGEPPPGAEPSILGYSGSDGTIAWAWPDRDLMILYFTQSRGGATVIRLEAEIERLLLDPPAGAGLEMPAEFAEYLGIYTANFGPFRNEPFEILWRDGSLALDIPSQFIFVLERVEQEERWTLRDAPGVEVSFARDEAGAVTDLRIDQGGDTIDLPRGEPEPEAEATLRPEDVEKYLGWFRDVETGGEVEVVLQAGRLALRTPEASEPLALFPPDDDGAWRLRMNPAVEIRFTEEDGEIVSYVARGPGGEATFTRMDPPAPGSDQ